MPVQSMLHLPLGLLFALVSLASIANAQNFDNYVQGDPAFDVHGNSQLVDKFELELKKKSGRIAYCDYIRFLDFMDLATKEKLGGLLIACESKKAYSDIETILLSVTKGENKRHLSMTHMILQSCPDKFCKQDKNACLVYPCPSRPTPDGKDLLSGYYFGCYHKGFPCDEVHACIK